MRRPAAYAHLTGVAALFVLAVATTTMPVTTIGMVVSSEAHALLAWKASLVNATALSSWTRATPVCTWRGVSCNSAEVMTLGLKGLGLSGGIDTLNTTALRALVDLDLSGNNLSGAIPASISRLRSLYSLNLSNNSFSSSIPPKLGDMHNLIVLYLYNNNLVGDIPYQLCRLLFVQLLDISNNELTGELPGCWWNLQAMRFMNLSNNSFSGTIPAVMATHDCSLRSLYLAGNGFVGAFPPVLRGCYLLATLDMGNNMFFGGIPTWIGSDIPWLSILSLRSNNFTGEIPRSLSQLSQLQLLDLANNSLTGSIPVTFGNFTSMRHPQNLSNIGSLVWPKYNDRLNIIWKGQEQNFHGEVKLLAGIDLSGNLFFRCIPTELTDLQGLRFLNLSRNHLSCDIPEDIGSLTFLEFLDLSYNELIGSIPTSIASLLGLSMLNLSSNLLSGNIPARSQMQTLTDPTIYSNNSGLCGFPLNIPCEETSHEPDETNGEGEDQWLYYCVIGGSVSGFWLWFGMLFVVKTWRCGFIVFVDGLQCNFMRKVSD